MTSLHYASTPFSRTQPGVPTSQCIQQSAVSSMPADRGAFIHPVSSPSTRQFIRQDLSSQAFQPVIRQSQHPPSRQPIRQQVFSTADSHHHSAVSHQQQRQPSPAATAMTRPLSQRSAQAAASSLSTVKCRPFSTSCHHLGKVRGMQRNLHSLKGEGVADCVRVCTV